MTDPFMPQDQVDPDSVCYCGWAGLDDSGCLCVHPELRGPICVKPDCDEVAEMSIHQLCEEHHNEWANGYFDALREKVGSKPIGGVTFDEVKSQISLHPRRDICWWCAGKLIWQSDDILESNKMITSLECESCDAFITYTSHMEE